MVNICMCGTAAGYMHASDCPFPLFVNDPDRAAQWLAAREALRAPQAGQAAKTMSEHITRLCECLEEAASFAQQVSPGSGHNAGMWATAITEARAALAGDAGATAPPPASPAVALILKDLADRFGNDWPEAALERLLLLTARYGYAGAWSEDLTERFEQEERLALHRWAREVLEAGIAFHGQAY